MADAKVIPLEKRTKKEQRRYNNTRRADWNGVVPVTRVIPNKKKQNRRNDKDLLRTELV